MPYYNFAAACLEFRPAYIEAPTTLSLPLLVTFPFSCPSQVCLGMTNFRKYDQHICFYFCHVVCAALDMGFKSSV